MALPSAFLDELRARTPMAALVGRRVKLVRSGKSWKGCCPFHGEKTPSFYVYDDGYHCFGCGAHGDAIGFVMQSQGASFRDAVDLLAGEAGLEVPKASPDAAAAERERLDLAAVLDLAAHWFARQLASPAGTEARAYLARRGLSGDTVAAFGLGWSGDGRGGLIAALREAGVETAQIGAAGLLRAATEGEAPRELFYNRVMFPIRDRRGRVISFGGRGLGDAKPKYINGPETSVFPKSRTLYGLDRAREGRRDAPVMVVEGYMDVIALHQAGLTGAVAPLGTALTAAHLEELWRLTPRPVLCFDGDAAGARAAARAAEVALPLLAPDRTLAFASLPPGEDPDSLVRRAGAEGITPVIESAQPLHAALYDLVAAGIPGEGPEARAMLRARLDAAASRIPDKPLAAEIRRALLDRFFATRRQPGKRPVAAARPVPGAGLAGERVRCLLAILLHHPQLLPDVEEAFARLEALPAADAELRAAILAWWDDQDQADALDSHALTNHLTRSGFADALTRVLAERPLPLPSCARAGAMPAEAEEGWWHFFQLLRREQLEHERVVANQDFARTGNPAGLDRTVGLHRAVVRILNAGEDEPE